MKKKKAVGGFSLPIIFLNSTSGQIWDHGLGRAADLFSACSLSLYLTPTTDSWSVVQAGSIMWWLTIRTLIADNSGSVSVFTPSWFCGLGHHYMSIRYVI